MSLAQRMHFLQDVFQITAIALVYHAHDTDMGNVHKMFITYIHRT